MKWAEQSEDNKQALAKTVARELNRQGYPITPGVVLEELASENRTVVGRMAADMLAQNGFEDME